MRQPRHPGAAIDTREPNTPIGRRRVALAAAGGAAARRRVVRVRPAARRPRPRVPARDDARAARRRRRRRARGGRLGPRRGRHLAARGAARAAARGRVDARRLLRPPRDARSVAEAAGVGGGAALSQLGVRVGGAGPRVAPGRPCPARRARPRAAAGALRQLAGPRRAALDRARAPAARPLAGRALQARRGGDLVARARRRGRGDRRGRHDRLQRPVRLGGEGSAGAGRAVRPRAHGVPGRLPGGSARPARDRAAARRSRRARRPTTRRSTAPRTSARRRFPRAW